MIFKISKIVIMGIFILFFVSPFSEARHDGSYLHKVTTRLITPHLDWAKPLSGGKIRALFIVPRTIAAREVVEIWQRLDLDYEAFTYFHSSLIAMEDVYEGSVEGGTPYEKTQEILRKLDKKYDVIILGHAAFDILPAEAKYKILKQVKEGTGLVFFYDLRPPYKRLFSNPVAENQEILNLVSLPGLPGPLQEMKKDELVKTYEFGEGKVAVINYPGHHSTFYGGLSLTQHEDYSPSWKSRYENNMVLVGRTILWASGRKPPVSILNDSFPNGAVFRQDSILNKEIILYLTGKKGSRGDLQIRVRDEWNKVCFEKKARVRFRKDKEQFSFSLPFLKSGDYYLDVIFSSGRGVENFGFFSFKVDSMLGEIKLETDKIYYEQAEQIKAKLIIEKPLNKKGELAVTLKDSPFGKTWIKETFMISPFQGEIEFTVKPDAFPTIAGYLICEIVGEAGTIYKKEKLLFFPKREIEDFPSFVWDGAHIYLSEFVKAQIIKAGFNAGLNHPSPKGTNARLAAIFNLRFVPYIYRIMLGSDEKGWTQDGWLKTFEKKDIEDGSFYNPVVREEARQAILRRIENIPLYGPLVYNLGDENFFSYSGGFSPSEEKAFKEFLRDRYQDIDKLNKEWQTNFNSFEKMKRFSLEELHENKKFPAWHDHRAFMEKQYGDYHHYLSSVIKEVDPYAKVGAEGSVPGNLEHTISKLEFWGPYDDIVMNEVLRSIGPGKLRTIWWGGYTGSHGGRDIYPYPLWRPLLQGVVTGNSWFSAFGSEGFLSADLSYAEYFEKMLPRLQSLYKGTAQLLVNNNLKNDGIALHWSQASYTASFMDERFFNPKNSMEAFIGFCYRNGLNFDFLTTKMMEEGKLRNYRILFLFGSSSISNREKEKIEKFVKEGGIVIADLNPGILNAYCRFLGRTQLERLFSVPELKGKEKFVLSPLRVDETIRGKRIYFEAEKVHTSPELKTFKINHHGKGLAILLNFNLGAAQNSAFAHTPFDALLLNLLELAGIRPMVKIEGITPENLLIRIRENSEFKILGLLANKSEIGKTMKISLPEEYFVYRVDKGLIGKKSSWEERIAEPFILYSLFKEEQRKPGIKSSKQNLKKGDTVSIDIDSLRAGGVLRVVVINPEGKEIENYRNIFSLKGKKTTLNIPFAYNDVLGKYFIEVTDVATGLKDKVSIEIR